MGPTVVGSIRRPDSGIRRPDSGIRRPDSGKRRLDSGKRCRTAANGAEQRQTTPGQQKNGAGQRQTARTNEDGNNGCSEDLNRERRSRRRLWRCRGDFSVARGRRTPVPAGLAVARGDASDLLVTGRNCDGGRRPTTDWPEISAAWRRVTDNWLSKPAWLAVARRDGPDPQVTRRNCDGGRRWRRQWWRKVAATAIAATAAESGDSRRQRRLAALRRRENGLPTETVGATGGHGGRPPAEITRRGSENLL
ncbi:hypothetical protein LR48_Vigan02g001700 [Vigna angularis]|uniref:Uncharacterized protein n=1 Tax=Phaseolus angularis TaxID=3914 RepID=A0A0L9TTW7_PHAAN|nr:hypothetical protein LR48_Vigan02g001700 [Vigna angularis]